MRYFVFIFSLALILSGCSNTWRGVKEDTGNAVDWSKDKINKGAVWVEEKTR